MENNYSIVVNIGMNLHSFDTDNFLMSVVHTDNKVAQ